jgi:hypothetical protein
MHYLGLFISFENQRIQTRNKSEVRLMNHLDEKQCAQHCIEQADNWCQSFQFFDEGEIANQEFNCHLYNKNVYELNLDPSQSIFMQKTLAGKVYSCKFSCLLCNNKKTSFLLLNIINSLLLFLFKKSKLDA